LGLQFRPEPDGSVVASFSCEADYQGYPDRLHGGVIAMLFDAAMTNCLFHRGLAGVTARLVVSFREPVRVNEPAEVRAHIASERRELCLLRAALHQSGTVKAFAEGKFMVLPG
jgi:acyl-coenzyme A thioesterase PaaI-like protein